MKTKTIVLSVVASALPALCIANNKLNMVIGTYTDNGSKGVYSFLFDKRGKQQHNIRCHLKTLHTLLSHQMADISMRLARTMIPQQA